MISTECLEFLNASLKSIPDFPKPGIIFRDITSLCENPKAFAMLCEAMADSFRYMGISKVAATEARGFVFGSPVAAALNAGLVMIRKKGKLPREVYREDYQLEYGSDTLEIHQDAISPEDRVLIVDDLIATGGTMEAAIKLVQRCGGRVMGASFAINLAGLGGALKIHQKFGIKVFSVLNFDGA